MTTILLLIQSVLFASIFAAVLPSTGIVQNSTTLPELSKREDGWSFDPLVNHQIRLPLYLTCPWEGQQLRVQFDGLFRLLEHAVPLDAATAAIYKCDNCLQSKTSFSCSISELCQLIFQDDGILNGHGPDLYWHMVFKVTNDGVTEKIKYEVFELYRSRQRSPSTIGYTHCVQSTYDYELGTNHVGKVMYERWVKWWEN